MAASCAAQTFSAGLPLSVEQGLSGADLSHGRGGAATDPQSGVCEAISQNEDARELRVRQPSPLFEQPFRGDSKKKRRWPAERKKVESGSF